MNQNSWWPHVTFGQFAINFLLKIHRIHGWFNPFVMSRHTWCWPDAFYTKNDKKNDDQKKKMNFFVFNSMTTWTCNRKSAVGWLIKNPESKLFNPEINENPWQKVCFHQSFFRWKAFSLKTQKVHFKRISSVFSLEFCYFRTKRVQMKVFELLDFEWINELWDAS